MNRRLTTFCCLLLLALSVAGADAPPAPPPASADSQPAFEAHIKAGREFFQDRRYTEALKEFAAAIQLQPKHHDARMFGGLSAYWGRQPELALECWNPLLDAAPRNSNDEWEIDRQRVMALSALGETDAAESVVDRLYEIRRGKKAPAALSAKGFVREHFYFGNLRVGVWEVFDERNEMPEQWTFPVTQIIPPGKVAKGNSTPDLEPLLKRYTVESTLLPGGGPGYQFTEYGPGYKKIYKHWTQKPAYTEVRPLIAQVMNLTLAPIGAEKLENQNDFAAAPEDPKTVAVAPKPGPVPAPDAHSPTADPKTPAPTPPTPAAAADAPKSKEAEREDEIARGLTASGFDPDVTRMLTLVTLLKEVKFDVTRAARLSQTDPGLAEKEVQALNLSAPHAQERAGELVELISKAKPPQVQSVLREAAKLQKREPYLDFVLLTAMNTRGSDFSETLLIEDLKHSDFMIRQTTSLLIGRMGDLRGLHQLFDDLKTADAPGCAILDVALEELLGDALGPVPQLGLEKTDALVKSWKENAAKWWSKHHDKLEFSKDPKTGEAVWKAK